MKERCLYFYLHFHICHILQVVCLESHTHSHAQTHTHIFFPWMFKFSQIKRDHIAGLSVKKNICQVVGWKAINNSFVCIFFYCTRTHLCLCAAEALQAFRDTPRAPAINDDNLNFDTLVCSRGAAGARQVVEVTYLIDAT